MLNNVKNFKTMKKLFFTILSTLILTACSDGSDDALTDSETDQEQEEKDLQLKSVIYPGSSGMAYTKDPITYEYDENNKISRLSFYNTIYGFEYINDNLIKVELIQDNGGNASYTSKKSVNIIDNRITHSITDRSFQYDGSDNITYSRDSTVFSYNNGYIQKIVQYLKQDNVTPITKDYEISQSFDYEVTDGNITKVTKTNIFNNNIDIKISEYTYDTNELNHITELVYESPVDFDIDSFILKNYIGKKNKNNIKSVKNNFDNASFTLEYDFINYTHFFNEYGRLINTKISGKTIAGHDSYEEKVFTDKEIQFTYE